VSAIPLSLCVSARLRCETWRLRVDREEPALPSQSSGRKGTAGAVDPGMSGVLWPARGLVRPRPATWRRRRHSSRFALLVARPLQRLTVSRYDRLSDVSSRHVNITWRPDGRPRKTLGSLNAPRRSSGGVTPNEPSGGQTVRPPPISGPPTGRVVCYGAHIGEPRYTAPPPVALYALVRCSIAWRR
jgi:hypothetical protein